MRAKEFLKEFAPSPDFGGEDDNDAMYLSEFADIIQQYLGRGYTRKDTTSKNKKQVSVKFLPVDKSQRGVILYSPVDPRRGEYPSCNVIFLEYNPVGLLPHQTTGTWHGTNGPRNVHKTRKEALKLAQMISGQKLDEFAPEGFKQYTLYIGDAHNRHKIETFADLEDAIEEAKFLMDTDPRTVQDYWTVTDASGEVVWDHNPGEIADAMRRGGRIQFGKPGDHSRGNL